MNDLLIDFRSLTASSVMPVGGVYTLSVVADKHPVAVQRIVIIR
jgi:hypothetical protein